MVFYDPETNALEKALRSRAAACRVADDLITTLQNMAGFTPILFADQDLCDALPSSAEIASVIAGADPREVAELLLTCAEAFERLDMAAAS